VPTVHPVQTFANWLAASSADRGRFVLSLAQGSRPLREVAPNEGADAWVLSGPEGGLSSAEESDAIARGFVPVSLGPRVLRAETAALAALASLS
jgi:16S rRNA (uracil1498-N3)-methyltransferase